MIYRETGNFVTNYLKDRQIVNLSFDKYFLIVFLLIMLFYVPTMSEYALSAHIIPILAVGLATLGLNILTGLTGQLSLGTAGFMSVGAFATYNLLLRIPEDLMSLPFALLIGGIFSGLVGVIFGLKTTSLAKGVSRASIYRLAAARSPVTGFPQLPWVSIRRFFCASFTKASPIAISPCG